MIFGEIMSNKKQQNVKFIENPVVIIPARLSSTRLPGKPLADICGTPMIVRVLRQAEEANCGPVIVACSDIEIKTVVEEAGGTAVMTRQDHLSGSDRIYEALEILDPEENFDSIINLQGDLPTISPFDVKKSLSLLKNKDVDIGTLASRISDKSELSNHNVVKIVVSCEKHINIGRALYFTRANAPSGEGDHWHHIGIYAYRRNALKRFVTLPPSYLEKQEKPEQLRAMEDGMRIEVAFVDSIPLGVDTPHDVEKVRKIIMSHKKLKD